MKVEYKDSDGNAKSIGGLVTKIVAGTALGLTALITGVKAFDQVPNGSVGLKTRFGEVVSENLPAGPVWMNPFTTDLITLNTQVQKWDGRTASYTKDVQQSVIEFTLTYHLDPAYTKAIYTEVGTEWAARLVGQVVVEEIKRELGQHNAVDFIAKRNGAARNMETNIRALLGARHVLVTGFQLRDVSFTGEFEKAVEEKQIAEQEAIKEKNKTVQIEEKAKQQVATAKGAAESTLINAKAEAESIQIRGAALAQNPRLVELVTAERWNGELPTNMYGSAPVPFINVPGTK